MYNTRLDPPQLNPDNIAPWRDPRMGTGTSIHAQNVGPSRGLQKYLPITPVREASLKQPKNISEMAISHIKMHAISAKLYQERLTASLGTQKVSKVHSLQQLAANNLVKTLRYDVQEGVDVLLKSCPPPLLRLVSRNPRLHFTAMRAFQKSGGVGQSSEGDVDLDELVLTNETYIRADKSDWGLVSLDDAEAIFPESTLVNDTNSGEPLYRSLTRENPPNTGFSFFDYKRPKEIRIQPSTEAFKETFNRLNGGCLEGLNWDNVLVAGGMALSTLLCLNREMDKEFVNSDIDMYIYGLNAHESLKKARHICDVWLKNLPKDTKYILVKNTKTITLLATYPRTRLQIILRLVANPAAVLLNFDLDQCAIGYNGKSVLMLPRAARALETGYSVFTMDMVHGHHLGSRRASQEPRLMKYASKGFGVRILPSYCNNVEIDFHDRDVLEKRYTYRNSFNRLGREEKKGKDVLRGLKAVKAIACISDDFTRRFYLGRTELTAFSDDEEDYWADDPEKDPEWSGSSIKKDEKTGRAIPHARFSDMDTYRMGTRAYGHRGIPGFELLMRHEAVWRFEQQGLVTIDYESFSSINYDGDTYDDLPKYQWKKSFQPEEYGKAIDAHNGTLFGEFVTLLEYAIFGAPQRYSYGRRLEPRQLTNYLTRRIRRVTHSQDIGELFDRFQITIALSIPYDLELYIKETFADALKEAGFPDKEKHDILIPVHKAGTGDGSVPDLAESTEWNLRYWVVDSTVAFAGIHRNIDEIYEILWTFQNIDRTMSDTSMLLGTGTDDESSELQLQFELMLARRVTQLSIQQLAGMSGFEESSKKNDNEKSAEMENKEPKTSQPTSEQSDDTMFPDERERSLFDSWLLETPVGIYRHYTEDSYHRDYHEQDYVFPSEHLYWREGVDGTSNKWTNWDETIANSRRKEDTIMRDIANRDDESEEVGSDEAEEAEDDEDDALGEPSRGLKRRREDSDLATMVGRE